MPEFLKFVIDNQLPVALAIWLRQQGCNRGAFRNWENPGCMEKKPGVYSRRAKNCMKFPHALNSASPARALWPSAVINIAPMTRCPAALGCVPSWLTICSGGY